MKERMLLQPPLCMLAPSCCAQALSCWLSPYPSAGLRLQDWAPSCAPTAHVALMSSFPSCPLSSRWLEAQAARCSPLYPQAWARHVMNVSPFREGGRARQMDGWKGGRVRGGSRQAR